MECIVPEDGREYHVRTLEGVESPLTATTFCGRTFALTEETTIHATLAAVKAHAHEEELRPCEDCLAKLDGDAAAEFQLSATNG